VYIYLKDVLIHAAPLPVHVQQAAAAKVIR